MTSRLRSLPCVLILGIFAGHASADPPTQFESVVEALESTHEFSVAEGTLKVLSDDPWHIEISADVFPGELPEILAEEVSRTLIYALIVSFAQSGIDKITVTVVPVEQGFGNKKSKPIRNKSQELTVTRTKMNRVLAEKAKVIDVRMLIGPKKFGDEVVPDMLLGAADRIMYNDQGKPGLNAVLAALSH